MEDDELSINSEDREETVRGDTDGGDDGEFNATVIELSDDEFDDKDPDVVRNCNLDMIQALEEMRWGGIQEDIDATRADIARIQAEVNELASRREASKLRTQELVQQAWAFMPQRASEAMSSSANSTRSKRSAEAADDNQRARKKNSIPRLREVASEQHPANRLQQPASMSNLSLTTPSDLTRGRPRTSRSGVVRPPIRSTLAQRGRGSSSSPSSFASRAARKPKLASGGFNQQFDQAAESMDVDEYHEAVPRGEQEEYSENEDDLYGIGYSSPEPTISFSPNPSPELEPLQPLWTRPPPELQRRKPVSPIPSPEPQLLKPAYDQIRDASDPSDTGSDIGRTRRPYAYEKLRKTTSNLNLTPIREVPTDLGFIPNLRPTGLRTHLQQQRQLQHRMPSHPNFAGNLTTGQETMAGAYPNSDCNTGYDRRDQFYGAPTGQNFASGPKQATSGFGGQHYGQAYPSPSRSFSPMRSTPMPAPGFAAQASASSLSLSAQGRSVQQGQAERSPYDMHPGFGLSPIRSPSMAAAAFGGQDQGPARLSFTSGSAYPQPSSIHARPSVEQFGTHGAVPRPETVMTYHSTVTSGLGTPRTGGEDTASATSKKSKRSKSPTKAAVGAAVPDSFAWDTTRGWVDLTGLEEGARKAMLDHSADLATNDRFLQYYYGPGREFDALCFGCRTVHRNAKFCDGEAGKKPGELKEACGFCCDTGTQPCGILIPHPQHVFGGARHAIGYVPLPSSKRDPATSWNQYDFWVTSVAEKDRPSRPAKARKSKSFGASIRGAARSALERGRRSTRHQKT